jgi:hypothetical protein
VSYTAPQPAQLCIHIRIRIHIHIHIHIHIYICISLHRHAALRPYEHYIPISRDLADLRAQLRHARVHDAAVTRMAARARRLAVRILSQRSVADYAREVLVAYAGLLNFEVGLHPEAVQVPLADD